MINIHVTFGGGILTCAGLLLSSVFTILATVIVKGLSGLAHAYLSVYLIVLRAKQDKRKYKVHLFRSTKNDKFYEMLHKHFDLKLRQKLIVPAIQSYRFATDSI